VELALYAFSNLQVSQFILIFTKNCSLYNPSFILARLELSNPMVYIYSIYDFNFICSQEPETERASTVFYTSINEFSFPSHFDEAFGIREIRAYDVHFK